MLQLVQYSVSATFKMKNGVYSNRKLQSASSTNLKLLSIYSGHDSPINDIHLSSKYIKYLLVPASFYFGFVEK